MQSLLKTVYFKTLDMSICGNNKSKSQSLFIHLFIYLTRRKGITWQVLRLSKAMHPIKEKLIKINSPVNERMKARSSWFRNEVRDSRQIMIYYLSLFLKLFIRISSWSDQLKRSEEKKTRRKTRNNLELFYEIDWMTMTHDWL